jgi:two-component system cell cycle sensor histidine kinase/response regulator CckA
MGRSGSGLGMAVVWGTVKDHQGYIDIRSTEGQGTVFELYFPVTEAAQIKPKKDVSLEHLRGDNETILLIDDIFEQRVIGTSILRKRGYEVNSVDSGEKALEYLRHQPVDLLVLDMIMGTGMDGLDTFQAALEINPRQKAIIASGFSETERVKQTLDLGASKYLKKPYTMEKIGLAVRTALYPGR